MCAFPNSYLSQTAPDLGLDGGVHLFLVDGHGDELVQDGGDALALGVIVVLAETHQVGQPGGHVLQAQVLQLDACNDSHSSHTASTASSQRTPPQLFSFQFYLVQ